MNKELALALDFKNAPKELQEAAKIAYEDAKALQKAKDRSAKALEEIKDLEIKEGESSKVFRKLLNAWEPST
jgi:hypothetical protein